MSAYVEKVKRIRTSIEACQELYHHHAHHEHELGSRIAAIDHQTAELNKRREGIAKEHARIDGLKVRCGHALVYLQGAEAEAVQEAQGH